MVIAGGAECLRMQPELGDDSRKLVDDIDCRTQLASATAKQLLALGQTDTGRPECLTIDQLLRDSARTLQQALGERVRLVVEDGQAGPVHVDPARLEQALINLAKNARDAMPEGGVFRIQVRERRIDRIPSGWRAAPGTFVTLTCSDGGAGVEARYLERIFEPYFSTKGEGRGTGLGLTMVRKTVEDAGGFIEVSSTPNNGTTFVLHLPLRSPQRSSRPTSGAPP